MNILLKKYIIHLLTFYLSAGMERYGADMIKRYIFGFALVVVGGFLSEYPEFMHKISKMIHKEDKTEISKKAASVLRGIGVALIALGIILLFS